MVEEVGATSCDSRGVILDTTPTGGGVVVSNVLIPRETNDWRFRFFAAALDAAEFVGFFACSILLSLDAFNARCCTASILLSIPSPSK